MYLNGKKPNFRPTRKRANPYRLMLFGVLIVFGLALLNGVRTGDVKPLFSPTATATRTINSFALEGETHFKAGDLLKAIQAFQQATRLSPDDAALWGELARIQTYSSASLTTGEEIKQRLKEALDSSTQAIALAPDSSTAHAIHAFVLDWNANNTLPGVTDENVTELLAEAERQAVMAITLDQTNTLALAYYAEILVDQQKYLQAQQYIEQAFERDSSLMDVYRIRAYTYETLGDYSSAIEYYTRASELMPNLTFLYIKIGKIWRFLGGLDDPQSAIAKQRYSQALEQFAKAARLNDQLGIKDPIPYLAITNTYLQMGEPLQASLNIRKAVRIDPTSADVYAQLGMTYHRSKNYEGAIPAFQCAIKGCPPEFSCTIRDDCPDPGKPYDATHPEIAISGLALSQGTVPYYYTYGSVLAGMSKRGENDYCTQAQGIFEQLKDKYAGDTLVMGIVKEGETICASGGG